MPPNGSADCGAACRASFDDCIARGFADAQTGDPLRQLMDVDFATQLPDDLLMLTDKMSMAVSLECRVPLLDQRLVELAAAHAGPRSRCAAAS